MCSESSRLESDRVWSLEPIELRPAIEQTVRKTGQTPSRKDVESDMNVDSDLSPGDDGRTGSRSCRVRRQSRFAMPIQVYFTPSGGRIVLTGLYPWWPGTHCSVRSPSRTPAGEKPSPL